MLTEHSYITAHTGLYLQKPFQGKGACWSPELLRRGLVHSSFLLQSCALSAYHFVKVLPVLALQASWPTVPWLFTVITLYCE